MASELNEIQALKRFLYFGNENGLYKVDSKERPSLVVPASAKIVEQLLAEEKGEMMVEEVSKFLSNNTLGTSRGPALFVLAVCARHADKSNTTKQAAMKVFATACSSSADMFTFITYCQSVKDENKGWGRALKKGVQRWFDSRDSLTLAKIITQQRTGGRWSYLDLLRVTHILPKTEGAKMMAKYIVKGLKAAQEEYGGEKNEDAMKTALAYLAAVEQLKTTTDRILATALIQQHKIHLRQVSASLQQVPEVLVALASHMSVQELLHNIGRLAVHQILESTFPAASDIAERISSQQEVQDEKISPIAVLIAMRVYENGSTALKWTKNNSVVEALNTAFATALKHNMKGTGLRYLLAVNVNHQFVSCWVHGAKVLSPVIAAAGLAQILAHTEKDPTLAFFDTKVTPVPLSNTMQMPEICEALIKHTTTEPGEESKAISDMCAPVTWAEKQKKAFDVIIVMTDFRHPKAFSDLPAALKQYRQTVAAPKAKLIVCGLTASHLQLASPDDPGMLDIAGFDATVPGLIRGFVTDSL